jgi:uncharacterized membrane protein
MQMRSAEEARSSAASQNAPASTSPHAEASTPPGDERPAAHAEVEATAEQDTTIFTPPEDPFAASGVTAPPNLVQGLASPGRATPVQGYVAPQLPARAAFSSEVGTTLAFTPNTAAGVSYLFLWISGVLIFFNERHNRYVRFHALQSILLGALATVAGVVASVVTALMVDISRATHWSVFGVIGWGIAALTAFTVVVVWSSLAVAAWTGGGIALPILG